MVKYMMTRVKPARTGMVLGGRDKRMNLNSAENGTQLLVIAAPNASIEDDVDLRTKLHVCAYMY